MRAVLSRILRALGVEREMKAPELGRSISKEELMQEENGFIAIVDRKNRKAEIWLSLKALMMDEKGNIVYKHQMKWDEYGITWQAYEINEFEVWPDADCDHAG